MRATAVVRRAQRRLSPYRSPRRPVQQLHGRRHAHLPSAFAAYGDRSWLVPPTTVVGPERIFVGDGVTVMEHGSLVTIGEGTIRIGEGVTLARFTSIVAEADVVVGDRVMTSDQVAILASWRGRYEGAGTHVTPPAAAPVTIGSGAYLGMSCVIGPGVTVGDGAFVGEGAVVLDDVPPHALVYGNPAVVVRRHDPRTGRWEGRDPHRPEHRSAG